LMRGTQGEANLGWNGCRPSTKNLDDCERLHIAFLRRRLGSRCSKANLGNRRGRPAMKTYITTLIFVFALATATSMMALTVHGDHTHTDPGRHMAGHQKVALLY
jgi:hypothetical protein